MGDTGKPGVNLGRYAEGREPLYKAGSEEEAKEWVRRHRPGGPTVLQIRGKKSGEPSMADSPSRRRTTITPTRPRLA